MFMTPAFAQTAGAAGAGATISSFLPLVLIFGIMYFLLIRPQQKKMKDTLNKLKALQIKKPSLQKKEKPVLALVLKLT